MKVAVPVWNGRVSPVFDTASRFIIFDIENGVEGSRETILIPDVSYLARSKRLSELGIEYLICGAISNHAASLACANGMRIIPWMSGDVEEVIDSFKKGALPEQRFLMPGCRERRRFKGRGRGGMGRWQNY